MYKVSNQILLNLDHYQYFNTDDYKMNYNNGELNKFDEVVMYIRDYV